jgi:nitric oxide reductase subunit B
LKFCFITEKKFTAKHQPVPEKIVIEDGQTVFTGQEIKDGQNVWQSLGGQQLGTVWGHGAYQAPDWTADWLHRGFIAVAFWNLVGAGIFGFLINPPIALYYMQGLNTTPVHGHTALFGVYGMLGIGLMLFVLRDMDSVNVWKEKWLKFSFWAINIGLLAMVVISVLPIGLAQTFASVQEGLWYARSAEFLQTPLINTLKWLRVIGDTTFALGTVALVWFVFGLKFGWRIEKDRTLND